MNLLKSIATVSYMTFFCRILGFIRDIIVTRIFGIGIATDAFFVAFKLPNLLRRIFAEGAFSQAFLPILIEYKNKNNIEATIDFISCVYGVLTLVLCIVTIIGMLTARWIILLSAPGFVNNHYIFVLTSSILRITFPYILFISLASMTGAILNTWNYFAIPAFSPIFLNISIIFFSFFFSSYFHPMILALAWATILGGVLQLGYQLFYIKKIGLFKSPQIKFHKDVLRLIFQMGPGIIGVSVSQISLVINTILASFLNSGTISWMYYADRLMEFPSAIFGISISTVLLPLLSKIIINDNQEEYSNIIDWSLRVCCILVIPSAVALCILSGPIIITLFQYGNFTSFDVTMTQRSLIAYSLGLIGIIIVKILTAAFYSCQDIKTPVKTAVLTLVITQLMNLFFIGPFKHAGLSLSISLAAYFHAAMLYFQLRNKKKFKLQLQQGWAVFLIRLTLAIGAMASVLCIMSQIMPPWQQGCISLRLLRLMIMCSGGMITYFTILVLLGFRLSNFIKYINI